VTKLEGNVVRVEEKKTQKIKKGQRSTTQKG